MTREEAIKTIMSATVWTDDEREALGILIPELKESEDERIRKELVNFILYKAGHLLDEGTEHKFIAYLEKQKENCKPADSIPSNCVSDAKCEDRWYKVTDSLPDNGRLVLANDSLGNTLLARYDGEGNWEVSVYDNEDYYCQNTITKWCEIPSEKQKEQKPKEPDWCHHKVDLSGCSEEYMKAYYDGWNNCNQQHSQCKAEQKPTKYLNKDMVYAIMNKLHKLAFSQLIPTNSDEYKKIDEITCDVRNLLDYPIEQKPIEWSEEDERILKGIIGKIDHDQTYGVSKTEMLSFLKSLRPQPHTVSIKDATKFGNPCNRI